MVLRTWKLTLEYDGTRYSGWQEQTNARTIAGNVRQSAEDFLQSEVELHGSGRTDAGVHALAQVAHLRARLKSAPQPHELRRALNEGLPADIAVLRVEPSDNKFHARHDAVQRSYLYQISTRKRAFEKKFVWWVKERSTWIRCPAQPRNWPAVMTSFASVRRIRRNRMNPQLSL